MTQKYILDGPDMSAPLEKWVAWRDSLLRLDQGDEMVAFELNDATEVIAMKEAFQAEGLKAAA